MSEHQQSPQGSPRSLDEVVLRAVTWPNKPPGADPMLRIREHFVSWMAQCFTPAYLRAGKDEEKIKLLKELWDDLNQ